MITGSGRSVKTIGGSSLRLRSIGEHEGHEMWEVYTTAQRAQGSAEVVKLKQPRRIGRIAIRGSHAFAQPLDNEFWTQAASLPAAARFLGQLAELGMI